MKQRRPQSLAEVASWGLNGNLDAYLREFVDEYNKQNDPLARVGMLAEEPIEARSGVPGAYLAAVAEYLSRLMSQKPPEWTEKPQYFLCKPHFGSQLQCHKAMLLASSPSAFRRRMIFVDENPLSRPHAPQKMVGGQS